MSRACRTCGQVIPKRAGRGGHPVTCEACRVARLVCVVCGVTFTRRASQLDGKKCCTKACGRVELARVTKQRAERARAATEAAVAERRAERLRPCVICGTVTLLKTCSPTCRMEQARRYAAEHWRRRHPVAPDVDCAWCARRFVPHRRGLRYCGRRCASKAARAATGADRGRSHVQRAKRAGVPYRYNVDPVRVFRLARWRCAICGVRTPERLRGTYHDRAPELDHIVPLAAGGPHTYDNVQLACRRCNSAKGATWQGQLRFEFDDGKRQAM